MISGRSISRSQLRSRFLWCVVIAGVAFGALLLRLAWLQVLQGGRYRYLSENNRIRLERLTGPRGMIFDRTGDIFADVRASFDALLIPAEVPADGAEALAAQLSQTLSMPVAAIRLVVDGPGPPRWKPRVLKRRLTRSEMARLEAHRLELPAVTVRANAVRHYPHGPLLGTGLGYVGEISAEELKLPAYAEYEPGDSVGRVGLEWAWEGALRGEAGGRQVEVDVRGRKLGVLAGRPAHPGRSLVLTADRRLQQAAEDALGGQAGSVVVLDVHTGDVLALVSKPSYDPNLLAEGATRKEWRTLVSNPRHPLQNRAILGLYPPGSVFKIPMALAGLAEGFITPKTQVFCPGHYRFAGRSYRCWKRGGHGRVDLEQALSQSCDVYFYQLGLDLGVDTVHKWARELGLGEPTGIDLPSEKAGLIPSKSWKRQARKEPWYTGETLSVAIGQGYVLTTPLQLASMIASVAHPQAIRMRPRIVAKIIDAEGRPLEEMPPREVGRLTFRRAHLERVRTALRLVVAGPRGTGRKAAVEGFPVAGKTGTSQIVRLPGGTAVPEAEIPWERRDHALFVAYAPADDPEIALAVVVEHGGHGGAAAAPVAREVFEAYRSFAAESLTLLEQRP